MANTKARTVTLICFLLLATSTIVVQGATGSYNYLHNGYDWEDACATGESQSPINLDTRTIPSADRDFPKANITNMGVVSQSLIYSTGYALEVTLVEFEVEPVITVPAAAFMVTDDKDIEVGTPIEVLPAQFHFHTVSEHTIDGFMAPAESHIVTVVKEGQTKTCDKNPCYAVFGTMLVHGANSTEDNAVLAPIFDNLPSESGSENGVEYLELFDLNELLPIDTNHYTYSGSLTTPPCTEAVLWHVFEKPLPFSVGQMYAHQKMVNSLPGADCDDTDDGTCVPRREKTNNRPVQPIHGREVYLVET